MFKKGKQNLNIADIKTNNFSALNKRGKKGWGWGIVLTFSLLSKNRNWNMTRERLTKYFYSYWKPIAHFIVEEEIQPFRERKFSDDS